MTDVSIRSRLLQLSPTELYLAQVKNTFTYMQLPQNIQFLPNQMGGPIGQYKVLEEQTVMDIIDFSVVDKG